MSATPKKKRKLSFEKLFKPRKYQVKSIKWCLSRPAAGLFLKPGLGKTVIILAVFHMLRKLGLVKRLLVVSNRRIIYNVWRQEVEKWNLPYTVSLVHGQYVRKRNNPHNKKRKELNLEAEADIYLINFEALEWLSMQFTQCAKFAGGMLAVDESAKVKTWSTGRTKALKKLLPMFVRRYILAGNPEPRSKMDLYAQIYMLDMGKALGSGITKFRNLYFYQYGEKMHGLYGLLEGAEEKINKAIKHLVISFGDEELDLPPLIEVPRYVQLSDKARTTFNGLEQNFIAFLDAGTITVKNAGVASGKLRQIAGGNIYLPYKTSDIDLVEKKQKKYEVLHKEKLNELKEIIEELGDVPVFISYEFDHERQEIQKVLKDCPAIYSKTSDAAGERLFAQWNQGKLPYLLGQSQSVSHGLNLQDTEAAVIYFSFGWDFDNFDQFRRRIWRQGQKFPVKCFYIIADDTLDDTILNVLTLKEGSQARLFSALAARYRKPLKAETMATSKAANKKVKKKKKTATKKAVAKKRVEKKPAKKSPLKKRANKQIPKKKAKAKKGPGKNRDKDGLREGSLQQRLLKLMRRKKGVTTEDAIDRLDSSSGSVRVNVKILRDRGFNIENDDGAYKAR